MPHPRHDGWGGFDRLIGADGKPLAKCQTCKKSYTNNSKRFLTKHRAKCERSSRTLTSECSRQSFDDSESDSFLDDSMNNNNTNSRSPTPQLDTQNSSQSLSSSIDDRERRSISPSPSENCTRQSSIASTTSKRTQSKAITKTKKQKRNQLNDSANEENEPTDDQRSVAVYKYFICSNTPYTNIELPSMHELLTTFCKDFKVPTSGAELQINIGAKAAEQVGRQNLEKGHNRVLQLIVECERVEVEIGDEEAPARDRLMAMTLLSSWDNDWTFVKRFDMLVSRTGDLTTLLDSFCDESVIEVKKEYNIDVLFVLHDGLFKLQKVTALISDEEKEIVYYKISEARTVLENLNCRLVSDLNSIPDINKYYDQLQKLKSETKNSSTMTMSTVIGSLFDAISNLDEVNQEIILDELVKLICPLQLASKILHPQMHTTGVCRDLLKKITDFYSTHGIDGLAGPLSFYIDKQGTCFSLLYKEKKEANPINFWEVTKLDKNMRNGKLLADHAIQILQVPAALNKIPLKKIFDQRNTHTRERQDFDAVFFTFNLREYQEILKAQQNA